MRVDGKRQADALTRIAGIDLNESRKVNAADYRERRDVNRDSKQAQSAAALITFPDDRPSEKVSVTALMEELGEAQSQNHDRERQVKSRKATAAAIQSMKDAAQAVAAKAAALRLEAKEADAQARNIFAEAEQVEREFDALDPLPKVIDVRPIRERIEGAEEVNGAVDRRDRKARLVAKAESLEAHSAELTESMSKRSEEEAAKLSASDLPVAGLGIENGSVMLDGLPLAQASDAQQLEVSCAIAMSGDSDLRVIRVRDGSLMDSESLDVLSKMAADRDYQVWTERVDGCGAVGFVIEDGLLASRRNPESKAA